MYRKTHLRSKKEYVRYQKKKNPQNKTIDVCVCLTLGNTEHKMSQNYILRLFVLCITKRIKQKQIASFLNVVGKKMFIFRGCGFKINIPKDAST